MLAEWKMKGWAEMMGRKPTPDDFIVPSREGEMRSRHHSRNKLLDDLKRLGMRQRRGHDLRGTFITLARVDGAHADLLQMVTHNPSKNIIDIYTSMPWPSLCAEVAKLNVQRRKGELVMLPKAVNAEDDGPQMAMFDAEGPPRPGLKGPDEDSELTSTLTTVQNTTRPDPKKLWDIRPLLKKVLVEAPGIDLSCTEALRSTGKAMTKRWEEPPLWGFRTEWRRRESNPLDGISNESGLDALNADSAAKQERSEGSESSVIEVQIGLSPLRCSNVANLLEWALEALAISDVDRARDALLMALDLVSTRPDGQPR
jgi:hypothetical protein